MSAALNGDGDAFSRIVELHQDSIAAQMRRFSRDKTVIEELVHDVFVEAFVSLKSYQASSPLLHWLRKVAVTVGYRYWKKQSRKVEQAVPLSQIQDQLEQLASGLAQSPSDAGETLGSLHANPAAMDSSVWNKESRPIHLCHSSSWPLAPMTFSRCTS
ncbi:MAG: sigma factor [Planctomycetota bacterium]